MIVLRVEIWPSSDESRRRVVAVGTISNVSNLADLSDYDTTFFSGPWAGRPEETLSGTVKNYPRRDPRFCVWDLIFRALRNTVGARNRTPRGTRR